MSLGEWGFYALLVLGFAAFILFALCIGSVAVGAGLSVGGC